MTEKAAREEVKEDGADDEIHEKSVQDVLDGAGCVGIFTDPCGGSCFCNSSNFGALVDHFHRRGNGGP